MIHHELRSMYCLRGLEAGALRPISRISRATRGKRQEAIRHCCFVVDVLRIVHYVVTSLRSLYYNMLS